MKFFLTIGGSAILAGLAAFSFCMAIAQLAFEYLRLVSKVAFPAAGF